MPSVDGLRRWVDDEHIDGFNVTIPFKQAVIPHLDALSPEAAAIGAVNCVVVEAGRLVGHNTDAPAFRQTLESLTLSTIQTFGHSYILGTGGAAHAVAYALDRMGIPHTFVSRHPEQHPDAIGYPQLSAIWHAGDSADNFQPLTLIINATPVGMYPDIDRTPLPLTPHTLASHASLTSLLVYDLVYNPSPTLLLRQAAALGAITCGGLAMLHRQAQLSWHLWGL
jgi:shikimate dehydrogenase